MSAWRRRAIEVFPERALGIKAASSATTLFASLAGDLRATYSGVRDEPDLADRVFAFAAWCLQHDQAPVLRRAAIDGLLLHLPNVAPGRHDVALRMPPPMVDELEPLYRSALPAEDFASLMAEIDLVRSGHPNAAA